MKYSFLFFALVVSVHCSIILTEIMYNPRTYNDYFEYIEIHNNGSSSVDLSGWLFSGFTYTFPPGTKIAAGAYYVIASDPEHLIEVYSSLSSSNTLGPFKGSLSNNGETITLTTPAKVVIFSITYSDTWSLLTDGLGSSLELMCYTAPNLNDPLLWAASPLPESLDMAVEYGGSPGAPGRWLACLKQPFTPPPIFFSEIMYHPYKETGYEEMHEYIEVYNNGTETVDMSMWRIICDNNGMRYTFPIGVSLAPGNLLVVAKDAPSLVSVYGSIKSPSQLYGGYTGNLPNKASTLAIIDNNGLIVDSINYDTEGSFPFAADALGGNNDTLPSDSPFMIPVPGTTYYQIPNSYVYKGQSLSRRSWQWGTDHGYNWYATNPSPGVSNLDTSGQPLLPVVSKTWTTPDGLALIDTTSVVVSLNLRPWPVDGSTDSLSPAVTSIIMTWFVDDLIYTPPSPGPKKTVSMVFNGVDGFNGSIPAQPSNSIVRYRFSITYADGRQATWPRLQDPIRWYSYFVDPNVPGGSSFDTYHIFVTQVNWQLIIDDVNIPIQNRRVQGPSASSNCPQQCCDIRWLWQQEVPATLVYGGVVYDGLLRTQGSRWNRNYADGVNVAVWGGPGPSSGQLNAYSYRFNLANFQKIGNNNAIILNKAHQGCTFYETPLYNYLSDQLGLPASRTSFARVRFNGYFLRFMMVLQHGGDEWIQDAYKLINKRCLQLPTELNVGDVYNSHGTNGYEGPYGGGDFSVLTGNTDCPGVWNTSQYYQWTYSRFTYTDLGYQNLINFVNTLNAIQPQESSAAKNYVTQMLDVNQFLAYYALDGWAETWDHGIHNQELYMRLSDNKWAWLPWDADAMFGENYQYSPSVSIWPSETQIKVYFTKNFVTEITNYYALLQSSVLSVSNLNAVMDQVVAEFNLTEAHSSDAWAPWSQNFVTCQSSIRNFFTTRWNYVKSQVGSFSGNVNSSLAYYTCPMKNNVTRTYNSFTSIPGPPSAPIVLYNESTLTLSVSWNGGNPQGHPIKNFYIISSSSSSKRAAAAVETVTAVTPASDGSGTFTLSVTPETTYSISVVASSDLGNSSGSPVSTIAIPAPPPPPPPPPPPQPISIPTTPPSTTPITSPTTTAPTTSPDTATPTTSPTTAPIDTPTQTPSSTPVGAPVPNSNSTDSDISAGSGTFWTLPVIIGIAVGGAVVLIVVIVIIIVVALKSASPEVV